MITALMLVLAGLSLAVWVVLLFFRSRFWLADQRLEEAGDLTTWPDVVAIIPARNEAETIAKVISSLLNQDYPGEVRVIVVDDNSDDGTVSETGASEHLRVISGKSLEPGWSGKLWAISQGIESIDDVLSGSAYVLLTDADIVHDPDNLKRLIFKAESEGRQLVSLMVKLRCESFWERWLIPAFVFFFQKLYPFPAVNDPARPTAAAAGGCMLVHRDTLADVGGIAAIRGELIDDCALARLIKAYGSIWLGLARRTRSLRAYNSLSEIWDMVARTAFMQLNHSVSELLSTIMGMVVIYLIPPAAVISGMMMDGEYLMAMGGVAWGFMVAAYAPTLALYGFSPLHAFALPLVAGLYSLMTISSALRHWRGRGVAWKGRQYGSNG